MNFLRSETFIFLTLLLVIISQVIHTMYLFETVRVFDLTFTYQEQEITAANWLHAFVFAVAIESAILMFILNGKRIPSKIYAVTSLATNLLYYKLWLLPAPAICSAVLISTMHAASIWFFSDLLAEKMLTLPKAEDEDLKKIMLEEAPKIFKTTMPMNAR